MKPAMLAVSLIVASIGAGCSPATDQPAKPQAAQGATAPATSVVAQAAGAPVQALPDFAAIAEANKGAVVNIRSTVSAPSKGPFGGRGNDDNEDQDENPMNEFLRRFGMEGQMPPQPREGMGSGFIVGADGVILTNAHVVEGADEVRVKLSDRREFKGKVVGLDHTTDIAVVRIDAKSLPTVKLGDASKIRVGEWVVAIGSPFGFENTVTSGIVSGTSRSLPEGSYVPFIQTDAAVNPGNSGGPLFNMQGEVIGINSAIYSRTGGYMGLAFAIPIDVAKNVEEQLLKTGKVQRGRLGVGIQEVSASLAKSFGLDRPTGALVSTVESGGPAEKAGLQPGDVILGFNGKKIETSSELPPLVAQIKPGTKSELEIWRGGKKQTLGLAVGEMKNEAVAKNGQAKPEAEEGGKLGLAVRALTPEEKKALGGNASGLVVERATGPAAKAGLRRGDLITAVNGKAVKSVEELRAMVSKAKDNVALLVRRGDATVFVPIEIG